MKVKVIRSPKRKKTIEARTKGDTLFVYIPSTMSKENEDKAVKEMVQKIANKRKAREYTDKYLIKKFDEFNAKYFEGKLSIKYIKFVTNQHVKLGSCTPDDKTIRISDKLIGMPKWVLDYVIIHEMAHLIYPNHSKGFWKKVHEYRYTERAIGFLIANGMNQQKNKDY
ncbi:MAG: SprT-like domain-containing protein [Thermoplasmata archaeon]